ncbi:MAG: DUF721 domain-containing protein [Spirochaetes bacterium]|nr:DUF721 domain-containing protein [Spirochaetota bacterium]
MEFLFSSSRKERLGHVTSFRDLLPEMLKRFELQQPFTIGSVRNAWQDITGDSIAANTSPESIAKDTLFIRSKHPAFSNEISLMKNVILSKLNNKFKTSLKDIRVLR